MKLAHQEMGGKFECDLSSLTSSLERLPRLSVVHALVDDHVFGFGRAKVERDVGQLVLLGQGDGQARVLRLQVGRRESEFQRDDKLTT
jgi:hypothetical protein